MLVSGQKWFELFLGLLTLLKFVSTVLFDGAHTR